MDPLRDILPQGAYTNLDALLRMRYVANEFTLFARRPSTAIISGSVRTRFRGRGMEFEEVRLYQPGDDIRSIDWRVTARTQVAHTKLFREEKERPVFVLVDQRASMFFGSQRCFKSVYTAHLAALLGWAALAQSDRIGALVFGNNSHRDIRPRRSKHALLELLYQIHDFNHRLNSPIAPSGSSTMADMLSDVRRISKPGSAVFLLSDFHDFDHRCEELLFQLGRHADVSLFHVFDQLEKQLPQAPSLTISNGEKRLAVNTMEAKFNQSFTHHFEQRLHHLAKTCSSQAIPLISANTRSDPIQLLRDLYGRKKRHA